MTKLFEYQSKELLAADGIKVAEGYVAENAEEAEEIAGRIGCPVVIKGQILVTGRAKLGAIQFANSPAEAGKITDGMFKSFQNKYNMSKVLVEKKLDIKKEYFASIFINDALKSPVVLFSSMGGSGIEELSEKHPDKLIYHEVKIREGFYEYEARNMLIKLGIPSDQLVGLSNLLIKLFIVAKKNEARSAEINPIGLTDSGKIVAVDGRIVIDDNAVFRHPELGIEVAREFDHPPTILERVSYKVEEHDFRGTFYFMQMETDTEQEGYIGFHGAGGGGSMMGMDALMRAGFKIANFCDTSGNPPASKIYRAAKIILSQPGIQGYFHSGSGMASQEQYHTARGLVKAFREVNLSIPAVLRLGGNSEEEAIKIIQDFTAELPSTIEVYGRNYSVDFCAQRLKELISLSKGESR